MHAVLLLNFAVFVSLLAMRDRLLLLKIPFGASYHASISNSQALAENGHFLFLQSWRELQTEGASSLFGDLPICMRFSTYLFVY